LDERWADAIWRRRIRTIRFGSELKQEVPEALQSRRFMLIHFFASATHKK
jgi:hypothetical protein